MFEDGDHRWTWAGDRVMVAALEERQGDVPNWDRKVTSKPMAGPKPFRHPAVRARWPGDAEMQATEPGT